MSVKDTKLEEKEQLVVKGEILADSFAFRTTGEKLQNSEDELPSISGNAGRYLRVNAQATGTKWDILDAYGHKMYLTNDIEELRTLYIGDTTYEVFSPVTKETSYLLGKIISEIKVQFTVGSNSYTIRSIQLTNSSGAYAGIDVSFDTFRNLGVDIPTVEDHITFSTALQMVYSLSASYFYQLVKMLAFNNNVFVYKNTLSIFDGVDSLDFDLIRSGTFECYYLNNNGATMEILSLSALLTTLESGTTTNISGWVND